MKKLAITVVAAAFMIAPVMANHIYETSTSIVAPMDFDQDKKKYQDGKKDKEEVNISDLPTNITAALNSNEYAGWEAKEAWKMKTDEGWVYKVKLMKGTETKKVKFTKEGKALVS